MEVQMAVGSFQAAVKTAICNLHSAFFFPNFNERLKRKK
jgi:hypothetical protein